MKRASCTDYWLDPQSLTLRGEFEAMYRDIADPWGCEAGRTSLNNRLFLELLAEYRPYDRILDLGCGLGGVTALLKERFSPTEAVGCDISETAVRKASALHAGISFRHVNALDPLDSLGTANLVTISEMLWYVLDDLEQVFVKVARLLRDGGILGMHQYFPSEQRFGRHVIDGLHGFDDFLAGETSFVPKSRVVSEDADGSVLLAAYTVRST